MSKEHRKEGEAKAGSIKNSNHCDEWEVVEERWVVRTVVDSTTPKPAPPIPDPTPNEETPRSDEAAADPKREPPVEQERKKTTEKMVEAKCKVEEEETRKVKGRLRMMDMIFNYVVIAFFLWGSFKAFEAFMHRQHQAPSLDNSFEFTNHGAWNKVAVFEPGSLHEAAAYGDLAKVRQLVETSLVVNKKNDVLTAKDKHLHTAFYWAATNGHPEVANYLLRAGGSEKKQESQAPIVERKEREEDYTRPIVSEGKNTPTVHEDIVVQDLEDKEGDDAIDACFAEAKIRMQDEKAPVRLEPKDPLKDPQVSSSVCTFDAATYIRQYPDLWAWTENWARDHYLGHGIGEERRYREPNVALDRTTRVETKCLAPKFSTSTCASPCISKNFVSSEYLALNSDITPPVSFFRKKSAAYGEWIEDWACDHYLRIGHAEGRAYSKSEVPVDFDAARYLAKWEDLTKFVHNWAKNHADTFGKMERRDLCGHHAKLGCDHASVKALTNKALHKAAFECQPKLMKRLLLAPHQDVNGVDEEKGWTALHHAANAGCEVCVTLLLTAGADKTINGPTLPGATAGVPARFLAASNGHDGVVMLLDEKV